MNESQVKENILDQYSKSRTKEFATPVGRPLAGVSGQAPRLDDSWLKPVTPPTPDTRDPVDSPAVEN
jgi:hypothetical protein